MTIGIYFGKNAHEAAVYTTSAAARDALEGAYDDHAAMRLVKITLRDEGSGTVIAEAWFDESDAHEHGHSYHDVIDRLTASL